MGEIFGKAKRIEHNDYPALTTRKQGQFPYLLMERQIVGAKHLLLRSGTFSYSLKQMLRPYLHIERLIVTLCHGIKSHWYHK